MPNTPAPARPEEGEPVSFFWCEKHADRNRKGWWIRNEDHQAKCECCREQMVWVCVGLPNGRGHSLNELEQIWSANAKQNSQAS